MHPSNKLINEQNFRSYEQQRRRGLSFDSLYHNPTMNHYPLLEMLITGNHNNSNNNVMTMQQSSSTMTPNNNNNNNNTTTNSNDTITRTIASSTSTFTKLQDEDRKLQSNSFIRKLTAIPNHLHQDIKNNNNIIDKLHNLLSLADEEDEQHIAEIISWQPNGKGFVIHQHKNFVQQIIPRFFRGMSMAAFLRQLKLRNFSIISKGINKKRFCHELFLRNRPDLCKQIIVTRRPSILGCSVTTNPSIIANNNNKKNTKNQHPLQRSNTIMASSSSCPKYLLFEDKDARIPSQFYDNENKTSLSPSSSDDADGLRSVQQLSSSSLKNIDNKFDSNNNSNDNNISCSSKMKTNSSSNIYHLYSFFIDSNIMPLSRDI